MKKLPFALMACLLMCLLGSCLSDSSNDIDTDWRDANIAWWQTQLTNTSYYTRVEAPWDSATGVLMHWFNDTTLTKDNLKPLYTSMVDVKYHVSLYNGEPLDSSYLRTSPADSVYRTRLSSGVITGWPVAISKMHIGDSCQVIIPFSMGYGVSDYMTIKAYSMLVYNIKLVGIPAYETKDANYR